jgi:hypothetical protein
MTRWPARRTKQRAVWLLSRDVNREERDDELNVEITSRPITRLMAPLVTARQGGGVGPAYAVQDLECTAGGEEHADAPGRLLGVAERGASNASTAKPVTATVNAVTVGTCRPRVNLARGLGRIHRPLPAPWLSCS